MSGDGGVTHTPGIQDDVPCRPPQEESVVTKGPLEDVAVGGVEVDRDRIHLPRPLGQEAGHGLDDCRGRPDEDVNHMGDLVDHPDNHVSLTLVAELDERHPVLPSRMLKVAPVEELLAAQREDADDTPELGVDLLEIRLETSDREKRLVSFCDS